MALTANLAKTSVSADGTTTVLTDITIYDGANPPRSSQAVYIRGFKVDEDLVETELTIAAYDPLSATYFTITNVEDGHYKFYFAIVPQWNIAEEYDQYDIVYDATLEGFYQYTNETSIAGSEVFDLTYWIPITHPTDVIEDIGEPEESLNTSTVVYQTVMDYITAKCYATAVIKSAKEGCGADGDCGCSSKLGKAVHRLHTLLTVMQVSNVRQMYTQAEKQARTAEKYCDDCGCLNQ